MDSPHAELLRHFRKATNQFKLCPNRVWAAARKNLPLLMPDNFGPIPGYEQHEWCTFDFCQYSQRDFIAVKQRHECEDGRCDRLRYLFSRAKLDEAAANRTSTVWHLDGTLMIEPPTPYMAISHVWSDGTGIGAWPDGEINECLYTFFRDIATLFQCEGIWWDTLCIPQGKKARNMAIKNIPNNYQDARITLVHDYFLRNCEWDERTACFAILMSPWFSRGWTAVELARSRKVKVIFRGPCGPLIKDLDEQILAKYDEDHGPRKEASKIIQNLRKGITNMDHLLTVLGPRHTSWPRDMVTISALLTGVAPMEQQQETNKNILKKMRKLSPRHLFHNAATLSTLSWCPTSLLNMPKADSDYSLQIEENWDITGWWEVVLVSSTLDEKCVWNESSALMREKAHEALTSPNECVLLVEPGDGSADKALLVTVVREDKISEKEGMPDGELLCQYVGAVYFYPPTLKEYAKGHSVGDAKPIRVRLLGNTVAEADEQAHYSEGDKEGEGEGGITVNTEATKNEDEEQNDLGIRRFISAASSGDKTTVEKILLQTPTLVNTRDSVSKRTALHYATWGGHVGVAHVLLQHVADVNIVDARDQTPLHLAAERGDKAIVESLLGAMLVLPHTQYKATLNARCSYGKSALHCAAWGGSMEVIDRLMSARSDVHIKDNNGNTALHIAVKMGFEAISALLINNVNCNVDSKGPNGVTPLHFAAMYGHEGAAKLLLGKGANVNLTDTKIGWTSLHLAAMNGHEAVVKLLLEKNADAMAMDSNVGWTPLHLATMNGHEAVAELLEKAAHRCLVQVDKFGWSLQHFAAIKGHGAAADRNLMQVDRFRWTQLHVAAMNGPRTVIKLLLEQNPDFKFTDGKGRTPLHGAAEHGYDAAVRLLLDKGASVDAETKSGRTPLWQAVENGHEVVAKLLYKKGANINSKDEDGQTLLSWAAKQGHEATVRLLLGQGASLDTEDIDVMLLGSG